MKCTGLFEGLPGRGGGAGVHDGSGGKLSSRFGGDSTGKGLDRPPTSLLAEGAPVVMDGRGTALPVVVEYGVAEPVTVMAWLLVYSPHVPVLGGDGNGSSSSSNSSSSLRPPIKPAETALLSFARPRPYRLDDSSGDNATTITPAPGLHLSVGADEAFKGHLFYGGAADDRGRLTGFFSRQVREEDAKKSGRCDRTLRCVTRLHSAAHTPRTHSRSLSTTGSMSRWCWSRRHPRPPRGRRRRRPS